MSPKILFSIGLFATLTSHTTRQVAHAQPATQGFALVELFTSEGCSSCPPADQVVAALPQSYPTGLCVLSFHVDYWDLYGWKDPFSKHDYTLRQRQYTEVLKLRSAYTPQVIVNGQIQMVGSQESKVRQAIDDELARTTNPSFEASAHSTGPQTITVDYALSSKKDGTFHAALIQNQASTDVKDGENAGHQLHHADIVRDLKDSRKAKGSLTLSIPSGMAASDCKVVVFLQDSENLHVGGARLLDIH